MTLVVNPATLIALAESAGGGGRAARAGRHNPDGRGLNSGAYVRVGGERCTYNLWSRLGRAHLEVLLDSLRKL